MESCSSRGYFWTSVSSLLLLLLNACSIHTLSIPAILLLLLVETSNSVKAKDKFTIKMNLGAPFPLWSLSWSERDDSWGLPHCRLAAITAQISHGTLLPALTWRKRQTTDLKAKWSQDHCSQTNTFLLEKKKLKIDQASRAFSPISGVRKLTASVYIHKVSKIARHYEATNCWLFIFICQPETQEAETTSCLQWDNPVQLLIKDLLLNSSI